MKYVNKFYDTLLCTLCIVLPDDYDHKKKISIDFMLIPWRRASGMRAA